MAVRRDGLPRLLPTVILAAAIGSVTLATPRTDAAEGERPELGVNFHAMWTDYDDAERVAVLDLLAAAGAEWVRIDMGWSSFETSCSGCVEGWYVDRADAVVDAARSRGLQVLVMIHRTPSWANGGGSVADPPDDVAEFERFTAWMADHFAGRVAAYEIWNEPDLEHFWTGTIERYVELLGAGSAGIRSADPGARVVIAGTTYNNTPWLARALELGAGPSFDVVATHPYMGVADLPPETPDRTGDDIYVMDHVREVHELIPDKPIWFTEFGWSSHPNSGGEANWDRGVSRAVQADYLARTIGFLRREHPYVDVVFWYNERDEPDEARLHNRHYGLLQNDLDPKPAYHAFAAASGRPAEPGVDVSVRVRPNAFVPDRIRVGVGDRVIVRNVSRQRLVLDLPGRDERRLGRGAEWRERFWAVGRSVIRSSSGPILSVRVR